MEKVSLGNTDLQISRVGFGTMSLDVLNDSSETLLNHALEKGINYFDTADMYQQGANESLIGRAFRGKRKDLILATKTGNKWRANGSGWDWNPTKKNIISGIEESLQRLQTDHIDLYQLHGGTLEDPIDDIIEAFELLKASGKIRYYGISSIRPAVIREYVKRSSIVSVMMQYSLLDRRPEEEMLAFLLKNKIAVMARGTIAKGLLVNKPASEYLTHSAADVAKAALSVKQVAGSSRSPFDTAVQFVLQHPAVTSAIVGVRTDVQLADAISPAIGRALTSVEYEELQKSIAATTYLDHR